jgi:hypothetical protein
MTRVAQTLGISLPTSERYWAFARAWRFAELNGEWPREGELFHATILVRGECLFPQKTD